MNTFVHQPVISLLLMLFVFLVLMGISYLARTGGNK